MTETEPNIRNKLARGKFTAVFLVQCLTAIGATTLSLADVSARNYCLCLVAAPTLPTNNRQEFLTANTHTVKQYRVSRDRLTDSIFFLSPKTIPPRECVNSRQRCQPSQTFTVVECRSSSARAMMAYFGLFLPAWPAIGLGCSMITFYENAPQGRGALEQTLQYWRGANPRVYGETSCPQNTIANPG